MNGYASALSAMVFWSTATIVIAALVIGIIIGWLL